MIDLTQGRERMLQASCAAQNMRGVIMDHEGGFVAMCSSINPQTDVSDDQCVTFVDSVMAAGRAP